jgi:transposase-like protein
MERKRKLRCDEFPLCECGGEHWVYKTEGRTQRWKCDKCKKTGKKIKGETTSTGTKEHSE